MRTTSSHQSPIVLIDELTSELGYVNKASLLSRIAITGRITIYRASEKPRAPLFVMRADWDDYIEKYGIEKLRPDRFRKGYGERRAA